MNDNDLRTLATDSLLANVDLYADWLAAQCMGHGNVQLGYVSTHGDPDKTDEYRYVRVPELVALTLYPHKDVRNAAQNKLTERYIAEHIERVMAELAAGV